VRAGPCPCRLPPPAEYSLHPIDARVRESYLGQNMGNYLPVIPMAATSLRIVIADDDQIYRIAIYNLLRTKANLRVVAEAEDGPAAIQAVEKHRPDVVLMDISMPVFDGIHATSIIKSKFPVVRVIILSIHDENLFAKAAYEAGAFWYLSKGCSSSEIIRTIRAAGI
jgi:DNA-binding NarL/FixJ family response regulator